MNRIREIRLQKGMTTAELAASVGTSQPQIHRLETGGRRLTEEWMRRIAKALDVRPVDLIAMATVADFSQEVEPYVPASEQSLARPLSRMGFSSYTVLADSVALCGVRRGQTIIVNQRPDAIGSLQPGAVVLVSVSSSNNGGATLVLRQFLPPGLLTTNREGSNVVITTSEPGLNVAIVGVVEHHDLSS